MFSDFVGDDIEAAEKLDFDFDHGVLWFEERVEVDEVKNGCEVPILKQLVWSGLRELVNFKEGQGLDN